MTIAGASVGFVVYYAASGGNNTSFAYKTTRTLVKTVHDESESSERGTQQSKHGAKGIVQNAENIDQETSGARRHSPRGGNAGGGSGVKYRAVQIINREGGDPDRKLPIGTSCVGKLITAIDTRAQGALVRVLLPYGAAFDHDRRIDRGSVIFGTTSYPGSGEKVYLKFNRILLPSGQEFKIQAEALSSADYSPGISGGEHDGTEERLAGTVGLSMISGVSEVMVEKEALNQYAAPTPKSSLRNGFYNGMNKATQGEIERRAAKMNGEQDFVTIEAGADVIVSLTETFKGESL